jgi:hypothetical protein
MRSPRLGYAWDARSQITAVISWFEFDPASAQPEPNCLREIAASAHGRKWHGAADFRTAVIPSAM